MNDDTVVLGPVVHATNRKIADDPLLKSGLGLPMVMVATLQWVLQQGYQYALLD